MNESITPSMLTHELLMDMTDFVCFVKRNDQCLTNLDTAYLVLVPITFSVRDILSWPLSRFRDFQMREARYEYALKGNRKWWERAIWESPSISGFRLVTFEKGAYNIFVLRNGPLEDITMSYLKEVFRNRISDIPASKAEAVQKILEAGPENLWSYDDHKLPFAVDPREYDAIRPELLKFPTFSCSHIYSMPVPNGLSWSRCGDLVVNSFRKAPSDYNAMIKVLPENGSNCEIFISYTTPFFCPPEKFLTQCLLCNKLKWPGLYTCLEHRDKDITIAKADLEDLAKMQMNSIRKFVEQAKSFSPPEKLYMSFGILDFVKSVDNVTSRTTY